MRRTTAGCFVVALAVSGLVRADVRTLPGEQTLSTIEREEHSLRAELDSIGSKEEGSRRRLLLRGRAMYRLVRVGLLPVGGGFGSLLDHAIKMERARRALDDDMAEFRGLGDRKVALARKLDDLATRRAPLEFEREAATKARALLGEAEDRRRAFER